jgi:hypothetical protein
VKLDELQPVMPVTWIHTPRGGFALPMDVVIVSVGPKHVRIRVPLKDGRHVERVVAPTTLRARYM